MDYEPSNPVRLHDESIGVWYVQKVMTMLMECNPICNDRKLQKQGNDGPSGGDGEGGSSSGDGGGGSNGGGGGIE